MARPKSIAVWIRRNRQANGWTQVDLAHNLGYQTSASVNQWERGAQRPPERAMEALEHLFGPFDPTPEYGTREDVELEEEQEFAVWLRAERNRHGFTLAQLSERSGVHMGTISQIENGKITRPQEKTWNRLVAALEVQDVDDDGAPEASDHGEVEDGLGDFLEFNPHVEDERPAVPGIYVLYDISERPVYVGEGSNIRKRIKDHGEKFWFKAPIVETAGYIVVRDASLRQRLERLLIKFMKSNAVLNKQHVER
jgi:transcriptional regulator with XRE-family HTH domain